MNSTPRRFHLQRDHDVTGVSGTGRVANGILWAGGDAWYDHELAGEVQAGEGRG
ncbi:hypothetical protein [Streptomyces alfalfae]